MLGDPPASASQAPGSQVWGSAPGPLGLERQLWGPCILRSSEDPEGGQTGSGRGERMEGLGFGSHFRSVQPQCFRVKAGAGRMCSAVVCGSVGALGIQGVPAGGDPCSLLGGGPLGTLPQSPLSDSPPGAGHGQLVPVTAAGMSWAPGRLAGTPKPRAWA